MADAGHSALLLERTTEFEDRVRGEWLARWGVGEAKDLGGIRPALEGVLYSLVERRMRSRTISESGSFKTWLAPLSIASMTCSRVG